MPVSSTVGGHRWDLSFEGRYEGVWKTINLVGFVYSSVVFSEWKNNSDRIGGVNTQRRKEESSSSSISLTQKFSCG